MSNKKNISQRKKVTQVTQIRYQKRKKQYRLNISKNPEIASNFQISATCQGYPCHL